ncbi:hypothetical protein JKA74_07115 [Marivirga sp. S37H4]|uniref:Zinc-finger domain-containing protein n=1 Tax=Marivirga aurantiaca TaxID=2802615 RepID=A0A934WXN2_9BACT|nr:hypothetical protein [Marivirga aurantiaca]MBK6264801.1 hypothetical protein [Marivirga aurantiaca]
MSETNYFRLIDAYFDGSIRPEQKVMLENKIQTDPLLKAEFELQKNIINGISQVRTQQLKSRLSAIDVSGSGSMLLGSGVKWLAGTLTIASFLSVWLYWYMSDTSTYEQLNIELSDKINWKDQSIDMEVPKAINQFAENDPFQSKESNPKQKERFVNNLAPNPTSRNVKTTTQKDESAKAKPQSLLTFQDDNLFHPSNEKEFNKSIDNTLSKDITSETEIIFHNEPDVKEKYHYKYFNNKLYLYGDFQNEPYEIIELHSQGKKQLFLSYQDSIYIINDNVTNITSLEKVKDEMLILELELIMNEEK